jgi:hypothetical protein
MGCGWQEGGGACGVRRAAAARPRATAVTPHARRVRAPRPAARRHARRAAEHARRGRQQRLGQPHGHDALAKHLLADAEVARHGGPLEARLHRDVHVALLALKLGRLGVLDAADVHLHLALEQVRLEFHGVAVHAQQVVGGAALVLEDLRRGRARGRAGGAVRRRKRRAGCGQAERGRCLVRPSATLQRPPGRAPTSRTCCCAAAKGLGTTTTGQWGDASNAAGGGIAGTRRGWNAARLMPWKEPSTGARSPSPVESLAASLAPRGDASPDDGVGEAVADSSSSLLVLARSGAVASSTVMAAAVGAGRGRVSRRCCCSCACGVRGAVRCRRALRGHAPRGRRPPRFARAPGRALAHRRCGPARARGALAPGWPRSRPLATVGKPAGTVPAHSAGRGDRKPAPWRGCPLPRRWHLAGGAPRGAPTARAARPVPTSEQTPGRARAWGRGRAALGPRSEGPQLRGCGLRLRRLEGCRCN